MRRDSGTAPHTDRCGTEVSAARRHCTHLRGRVFLVFAIALVLVVVVAIVSGTLTGRRTEDDSAGAHAIPVRGEDSGPRVLPAAERVEPDTDEWEALLPRLQAVVDADPSDRNAQRKLALAYYNLGLLPEALALYESLLAAEEDPVLRNRLGNTLRDMADLTGAEAAYRQAIKEAPELAPPYINLAELLWRQGRDKEALAVVDEGLGAVPEEQHSSLERAREILGAGAAGDTGSGAEK